ncbi:MAG TPA: hypothetical protein VFQ57_10020 [Sphingomonas sp.]|jgi:hypothetical protein|nr:hypothetical protein [Sphingomonas sp.]
MKTISKLALAAVLATGVGVPVFVAPALAAKKEEPKGPKLTPAVQNAAAAAQTAMKAQDLATADTQLSAAEAAAVSDYDKYVVAALRYDLTNNKLRVARTANPNAPVDETVLVGPIDALLANSNTPAEMRGQLAYSRGVLAFNARKFPESITFYNQARQAGYNDPDLDIQIAKAKLEGSDVAGGLTELSAVIDKQAAAGRKPPEAFYRYGVSKANAAKMGPETLAWLKKWVSAYPSAKNWRDVIFVYGLQPNAVAKLDNAQRIDLFRLLRAAGALADSYDYREYAQLVYRGLPNEAVSVLKEGTASGKLAGSADAKSLMTDATKIAAAEGPLGPLETKAKASATGALAQQTGDVYLGQDNYAKAADLYRIALQKGGVNADEVNTRLGAALARSGDKAGAQAAFAAVKGAPRSDIAGLWSTWVQTGTTA